MTAMQETALALVVLNVATAVVATLLYADVRRYRTRYREQLAFRKRDQEHVTRDREALHERVLYWRQAALDAAADSAVYPELRAQVELER
jgi:hypothetical protein